MKTEMIVKSGLTAVTFLLISTAAIAQSAPAGRTFHHTQTANQSSDIKPRDAHSGMPTGRRQRKSGAIVASDYHRNGRESVQGTKAPEPPKDARRGDNPLYEGSGHSGTNPLYGSNRVKARPDGSVQKQPRRGDESKGAPLKGAATSGIPKSNRPGAVVQQKKHLAGVKYQNRVAAGTGSGPGHTQEK